MSESGLTNRDANVPQSPASDITFLSNLGKRVRQIRAQRGMSRRLLAESADVSERYLAQLETGKGNISILLLRKIAMAMGVRLDALVDLATDLPVEYQIVRERLRQMSATELQQAQQYLFKDDVVAQGKHKRIALIGLRGAGKSSVGRLIAQQVGIPFQELTETIELAAGMSLTEIFSLGGQPSYRLFEQQAINKLLTDFGHGVLAVGGSVVADTTTFEQLLNSFTTVWLQAPPEEHMNRVIAQGDSRPMAGNKHAMDELRRILIEREPLYRRADFIVDTHGKSVAEVGEEISSLTGLDNSEKITTSSK